MQWPFLITIFSLHSYVGCVRVKIGQKRNKFGNYLQGHSSLLLHHYMSSLCQKNSITRTMGAQVTHKSKTNKRQYITDCYALWCNYDLTWFFPGGQSFKFGTFDIKKINGTFTFPQTESFLFIQFWKCGKNGKLILLLVGWTSFQPCFSWICCFFLGLPLKVCNCNLLLTPTLMTQSNYLR